jgi:small ligand-binding sensory domain FIST
MLRFSSSSNDEVDSARAAARCLEDALGPEAGECDLLIFYTTMGHDFRALLASFRATCPRARTVGATCAGVIGREGPNESIRALAVMAVRGPAEEFAVAGVDSPAGSGLGSFEAAARIARVLAEKTPAVRMVLFHPSVLRFQPIDRALAGIGSVLPGVPVFGGLSADNMKAVRTWQFLDGRMIEDGAVAVGFADPTLELVAGANLGFVPVGEPFTVTSCDSNLVHELDGRNAWLRLTERLGMPETAGTAAIGAFAVLATGDEDDLGEEYGGNFIVRGGPLRTTAGSLMLNVECTDGMRLQLLGRDERRIYRGVGLLADRMRERCRGREIAAVFHADCLVRGKLMFDHVRKQELIGTMIRVLGGRAGVPWCGMYAGGEIVPLGGRNRIVAYTSALYVLARDNASGAQG